MKNITTESTIVFDMREDADNGDVVGSGHGMAVPYNTETMIGGVRESFAPDSFDPADVIGKPLAYRHGEPIGRITGAENREDGLFIDFDIVNTAQGRDAAVLARTDSVKGLSVGFMSAKNVMSKARDAITHTAANLLEVSLTPYPAYATAGVSAIRENEGETMSDTMDSTEAVSVDSEARESLAELRETVKQIEAKAYAGETVHELSQFRSFGEYSKAVYNGDVEQRALDVQTLADAPGLVPPVWLRDIKGVLDRGRPCITAIGGATSAAGAGMTINWPYFDGDLTAIVAAQAAEGDEVNSVDIDIKKGTSTLATYAAGSRLTVQVMERTDPSYIDAHNRIMLGAYGTETDYAFQAALWANDTAGVDYDLSGDTNGSAFREAVFAASVDVETATGQPAEVVYVSSAVFKKIGAWSTFMPDVYSPNNVTGVFNARTLSVSVAGLPVVLAREFATNDTESAIVTNRAAIGWIEDGPRLMTNDVAGNLGRDIAIYGYASATPFIPAGIVGIYDQTP
jgi:HK97 family phage prohead protease